MKTYLENLKESVGRRAPKLTSSSIIYLIKKYVKTYNRKVNPNTINSSTVLKAIMSTVDIVEMIMKAEEKFNLNFPDPKKDIRTVGQLVSWMIKSQTPGH